MGFVKSFILAIACAAASGCTPVPRYCAPARKPAEPVPAAKRPALSQWTEADTAGTIDSERVLVLTPPVRRYEISRVSSRFGDRQSFSRGAGSFHSGLDIKAAVGEEVLAASDGVVSFAGRQRDYGIVVIVDHGARWATVYAHLSEALVAMGDSVAAGDTIGRVGTSGNATGPHLHFEVRSEGKALDPLAWL